MSQALKELLRQIGAGELVDRVGEDFDAVMKETERHSATLVAIVSGSGSDDAKAARVGSYFSPSVLKDSVTRIAGTASSIPVLHGTGVVRAGFDDGKVKKCVLGAIAVAGGVALLGGTTLLAIVIGFVFLVSALLFYATEKASDAALRRIGEA